MKTGLNVLDKVLPLLHRLSDESIRDRHWREVMTITGVNFSLDGLTIQMLLELELLEHSNRINEVTRRAVGEAELENTLKAIDSEWNEQVFSFEEISQASADRMPSVEKNNDIDISRTLTDSITLIDGKLSEAIPEQQSIIVLHVDASQRLIDRAEDAHTAMTVMMSSPFLGPHTADLVSWMAKLNEIGGFLKRWLEVQALWLRLQSIFGGRIPGLKHEASHFEVIHRDYTRFTQSALECHNIVQWLYGHDADVTKMSLLESFAERLENNRKSISVFLESQRAKFPRLYFVTDAVLLDSIGSDIGPDDCEPICLRKIFSTVSRLGVSAQGAVFEVETEDTSKLQLTHPVKITNDLSQWLLSLQMEISSGVRNLLGSASALVTELEIVSMTNLAEVIVSNVQGARDLDATQIALMYLRMAWTAISTNAIERFQNNRHSHMDAVEAVSQLVTKFSQALFREQSYSPLVKLRKLQSVTTLCLHLREVSEMLMHARTKDQSDFNWEKRCRVIFPKCDEDISVIINGETLQYGYEFLGSQSQMFITPITERYFVLLSQALSSNTTSTLLGNPEYGQRETVQALANLSGRYLIDVACSSIMDGRSLVNLLRGASCDGSWISLRNFNHLSLEALSLLSSTLQRLMIALVNSKSSRPESSLTIPIKGRDKKTTTTQTSSHNSKGFAIFTTLSLGANFAVLPDFVRSTFRPISFSKPSKRSLVMAKCIASGSFRSPKAAAEKILTLSDVCDDQLSRSWHMFGLKSALRTVAVASARIFSQKRSVGNTKRSKSEPIYTRNRKATVSTANVADTKSKTPLLNDDTAIMTAFSDLHRPSLKKEHQLIFDSLVAGVFPSNEILPSTDEEKQSKLKAAISECAVDNNLVPSHEWVSKTLEIYKLAQDCAAVLLVGNPGVGKSSCIHTLVTALGSIGNSVGTHRVQRFTPGALLPSQLFGEMRDGEWIDGVFPSLVRQLGTAESKVPSSQDSTWAVFDGPFTMDWMPQIAETVASGVLVLGNGDRLPLPGNLKILFEVTPDEIGRVQMIHKQLESTGAGDGATGNLFMHCGSVFFSDSTVDVMMLTASWLHERRPMEEQIIAEVFSRLLIPVASFSNTEASACLLNPPLYSKVKTMLSFISALLKDSVDAGEILRADRIECIVLFSMTWSFGALSSGNDRKRFDALVKTHASPSLVPVGPPESDDPPPTPQDGWTIYDFYLDSSDAKMDWLPWVSDLNRKSIDGFPQIVDGFVHTVSSVCMTYLFQLMAKTGRNTMLVGSRGSGKTAFVNHFLQTCSSLTAVRGLTCSHDSTASTLTDFMSRNTERRTGSVYGASSGLPMSIYFSNLHLPCCGCDINSPQLEKPLEVLRLLVEEGKWFVGSEKKLGEYRWITDATILASMELDSQSAPEMERLSRHFAIFQMPEMTKDDMKRVLRGHMADFLREKDAEDPIIELGSILAEVSVQFLEEVRLHMPPVGERWYYSFTMNDLLRMMAGIRRMPDESLTSHRLLTFWYHEMCRTFIDQCDEEGFLVEQRSGLTDSGESTVNSDASWMNDKLKFLLVTHVSACRTDNIDSLKSPLDILEDVLHNQNLTLSDFYSICNKQKLSSGISLKEIVAGLTEVGVSLTKAQQDELLTQVDVNGDGQISFLELRHARTKHQRATAQQEISERFDDTDKLKLRKSKSGYKKRRVTQSTQNSKDDVGNVSVDSLPEYVVDFLGNRDCDPDELMFPTPLAADAAYHAVYPVRHLSDLLIQASSYLKGFNNGISEKNGGAPLSLTLSLTRHLVRVLRVLSIPRCNALLIGQNEISTVRIAQFGAYIANSQLFMINDSDTVKFFANMRAIYRLAGIKNIRVTALVRGDDLHPTILERLHSFICCGEIYDLFSSDELNALYDGLVPVIREKGLTITPANFFIERVRANFHVFLTWKSFSGSLEEMATRFPSLLSDMYVDHFESLSSAHLLTERAVAFFRAHEPLCSLPILAQKQMSTLLSKVHIDAKSVIDVDPVVFDRLLYCFRKVYLALDHSHSVKRTMLESAISTCNSTAIDIDVMEGLLMANADQLLSAEEQVTLKLQEIAEVAAEVAALEDEGVDVQDDEELLSEFVHTVKNDHDARDGHISVSRDIRDAKLREALQEVERWQIKITPKRADVLRALVNPPPLVRKVLDMVMIVLHCQLDTDPHVRRGRVEFVDSWPVVQGVISDPHFHSIIEAFHPSSVDNEVMELLQPYLEMNDVNSRSVRHAARETAVLFEWILRVVEYYRISTSSFSTLNEPSEPTKTLEEYIGKASDSPDVESPDNISLTDPLMIADRDEQAHRESIKVLRAKLDTLQQQFDILVSNKQALEEQREAVRADLKLAKQVVTSFDTDVQRWQDTVNKLRAFQNIPMLGCCAIAAAFVTYGGSMMHSERGDFKEILLTELLASLDTDLYHGDRVHGLLFADVSLSEFLGPISQPVKAIEELNDEKTVTGDKRFLNISEESATIIRMQRSCGVLPVVIDPEGAAERWFSNANVSNEESEMSTVILDYVIDNDSIISELRRCLSTGRGVLLTNVDPEKLWKDTRLRNLLQKRILLNSRHVRCVWLGNEEVEYNDKFTLGVSTKSRYISVPPEFLPFVAVINTTPSVADIKEVLEMGTLSSKDSRGWMERERARKSTVRYQNTVNELENQVLMMLGKSEISASKSSVTGLSHPGEGDAKWVATVTSAKAAKVDAQRHLDAVSGGLLESDEEWEPLINHAASVLNIVLNLPRINQAYQYWSKCLDMYFSALELWVDELGSNNFGVVLGKFVERIYSFVTPGLLEQDKKVFSLYVAFSLSIASEKATQSIYSVIRFPPSADSLLAIDQIFRASGVSDLGRHGGGRGGGVSKVKRDVDLSGLDDGSPLSSIIRDYVDVFQRQKTDWNAWRESKHPELTRMPGDLQDKISPEAHLTLVGALRPSRLLNAADIYASAIIDKYMTPVGRPSLNYVLAHDRSRPIVLFQKHIANDVTTSIEILARTEEVEVIKYTLAADTDAAEVLALQQMAMKRNVWLVVQCAHNQPAVCKALVSLVEKTPKKETGSRFRLWFTSLPSLPYLDNQLLMSIEPVEISLRANLVQCLAQLIPDNKPNELCDSNNHQEWLCVLHNICYTHCILQARQFFCRVTDKITWLDQDRWAVIEFARTEYKKHDPRLASIRSFMMLVYGRHIHDLKDRAVLNSIVDSWLSSSSMKASFDFQFSSGDKSTIYHKIPQQLMRKVEYRQLTSTYSTRDHTPRYVDMQQAIASLSGSAKLDESNLAELCGVHPTLLPNTRESSTYIKSAFEMLYPAISSGSVSLGGKDMTCILSASSKQRSGVVGGGVVVKHTISTANNLVVSNHKRMSARHAVSGGGGRDKVPVSLPLLAYEPLEAILKRIPSRIGNRAGRKQAALTDARTPIVEVLLSELAETQSLLSFVRQDLYLAIAAARGAHGRTATVVEIMTSLLAGKVPARWEARSWNTALTHGALNSWIDQLVGRSKDMDKIFAYGIKTPSFNLGSFFRPRALIAALRQESIVASKSGFDPTLRVEITSRDKDHLSAPAPDGIFIHNVGMSFCTWEGGTFKEAPTIKRSLFPVILLTFAPPPESFARGGKNGQGKAEIPPFQCAVYSNSNTEDSAHEHIFTLDIPEGEQSHAALWGARGVAGSLRAY